VIDENEFLKRFENIEADIKQIKTKLSLRDDIVYIQGVKIYVPNYPLDHIQACIVDGNNFYEFLILKCLNTYLNNNSIVFDIGANIGNHSLYWGIITNVSKVYAFEPIQPTFEILKKNIEINNLYDKVILNNIGLGKSNSFASLAAYWPDNIGESQLKENRNGNIPLITLDEYVEKLQPEINRIDLIKIDTEHFEYDVILGSAKTMQKYKPLLFVEIFENEFERVNSLLENLGYKKAKNFYNSNFLFEYSGASNDTC
jgi:FkbM family methyltransferase